MLKRSGLQRGFNSLIKKYNADKHVNPIIKALRHRHRSILRENGVVQTELRKDMITTIVAAWCLAIRAIGKQGKIKLTPPLWNSGFKADLREIVHNVTVSNFQGDTFVPALHPKARDFFLDLQRDKRSELRKFSYKKIVVGVCDWYEAPLDRRRHQPRRLSPTASLLRLNPISQHRPMVGRAQRYDIDFVIPRLSFVEFLKDPYDILNRITYQRREHGRLHPECQSADDFDRLVVGDLRACWVAQYFGWHAVHFGTRQFGEQVDDFHAQHPDRLVSDHHRISSLRDLADWTPSKIMTPHEIAAAYWTCKDRQIYPEISTRDYNYDFQMMLEYVLQSIR